MLAGIMVNWNSSMTVITSIAGMPTGADLQNSRRMTYTMAAYKASPRYLSKIANPVWTVRERMPSAMIPPRHTRADERDFNIGTIS